MKVHFSAVNLVPPLRRAVLALALASLAPWAAAQERVRISGTGSGTGGMQVLLAAFERANPGVQGEVLPALGSTGGIRALLDARIEVAVSNRLPNDKEKAAAALQAQTYAHTPFVVALHRDLGISALSAAELAALYKEGTVNFPNGRRARPVLRMSDAADTQLLGSMDPEVAAAIAAAGTRRGMLDAATDTETADLIQNTPGAFGPSTLALIESEKRPLVALVIGGKAPTLANLASGAYPWQKALYIVTGPQSGALAQRFVAFVMSAEGRRLLAGIGHGAP